MLLRIDKMIYDSGKHIVRSGMSVGVGRGVHGGGVVMAAPSRRTRRMAVRMVGVSVRRIIQQWSRVSSLRRPRGAMTAIQLRLAVGTVEIQVATMAAMRPHLELGSHMQSRGMPRGPVMMLMALQMGFGRERPRMRVGRGVRVGSRSGGGGWSAVGKRCWGHLVLRVARRCFGACGLFGAAAR